MIDIKPDNLLVSEDGILKIVDFGVAQMFTKLSDKLPKSAGSPAFFAPEMCALQKGEISAKACDVWALGITLFCMVNGRLPFGGNSILDLYDHIQGTEILYPSSSTKSLIDFLQLLLDRNPETRITVDQMREHSWITKNGSRPLPTKLENTKNVVTEVSHSEVESAVSQVKSVFAVVKAVSKFKRSVLKSSTGSLPVPEQ